MHNGRREMKKMILFVIFAILVVATAAYFTLMCKKISLEAKSIVFKNNIVKWHIERIIEIALVNKGENNITLNEIKVNGKIAKWTAFSHIILPGSICKITVFYPWNTSKKYSIEIVTDKGSLTINADSPKLFEIKLKIFNRLKKYFKDIVSFEIFFGDGECKPHYIKVIDEKGNEVISQMWGIVLYSSGYVKSAVISFLAEIPPASTRIYKIVLTSNPVK